MEDLVEPWVDRITGFSGLALARQKFDEKRLRLSDGCKRDLLQFDLRKSAGKQIIQPLVSQLVSAELTVARARLT